MTWLDWRLGDRGHVQAEDCLMTARRGSRSHAASASVSAYLAHPVRPHAVRRRTFRLRNTEYGRSTRMPLGQGAVASVDEEYAALVTCGVRAKGTIVSVGMH
eukprot:624356-Pleurochrysis_carterae.AAC.1